MYEINKLKPIYSNDLIRLGRKWDGGYVINKRLIELTNSLVTFGISTDWTFESGFKSRKKNRLFEIFAFDFSIDFKTFIQNSIKNLKHAIQWKDPFNNVLRSLHYFRVGIKYLLFINKSGINFKKYGIAKENLDYFKNFDTILNENSISRSKDSVFVKMDIESNEYEIIPDILKHSDLINGMVIEFHDLVTKSDIFESAINKIREHKFVITHIHPNNAGGVIPGSLLPQLLEISFMKEYLLSETEAATMNSGTYPIYNLDYKCVKSMADITLPFNNL